MFVMDQVTKQFKICRILYACRTQYISKSFSFISAVWIKCLLSHRFIKSIPNFRIFGLSIKNVAIGITSSETISQCSNVGWLWVSHRFPLRLFLTHKRLIFGATARIFSRKLYFISQLDIFKYSSLRKTSSRPAILTLLKSTPCINNFLSRLNSDCSSRNL